MVTVDKFLFVLLYTLCLVLSPFMRQVGKVSYVSVFSAYHSVAR